MYVIIVREIYVQLLRVREWLGRRTFFFPNKDAPGGRCGIGIYRIEISAMLDLSFLLE